MVWDGDGTLWDSKRAQAFAHNQTRKELGVPTLTREQLYVRMGGRSLDAFSDVPSCFAPYEVRSLYYHYYSLGVKEGGIVPRKGAIDAVETLHEFGFQQAISTHGWRFVVSSLRCANIPLSCFGQVVDAYTLEKTGIRGKPFADPFLHAAWTAGVTPDNAVMVGDMPGDVRSGQGYGIDDVLARKRACAAATIAVVGGCGAAGDLLAAEPTFTVSHPAEVPERVLYTFAR